MAHDLFNASMMFAGAIPWHGLGVAIPRNATWEQTKTILPFYTVEEREVFAAGLEGAIPDRKALVASNDGRYLATVGKDYGVVQFEQLAEVVMRAAGTEAVFHTAGLMGDNGARGWLLGELPNPIRVKNDPSEVRKFFLATTAHDGTSAVHLRNVATRVVCRNTLAVALDEKGAGFTIRHTSRAALRVEDAGKSFANLVKGMERFGVLANMLADLRISTEQTRAVLAATLPVEDDASDALKAKTNDQRAHILQLAESGTGISAEMRGTAWGLFQGITEWADHKRPVRGVRGLPSTTQSFEAQMFGAAVDVKRAGLTALLSIAR